LLLIVLASPGSELRADTTVELARPHAGELMAAGFELSRRAHIEVEAVGLIEKHGDKYVVDAWILAADTRRPVWSLAARDRKHSPQSRLLRKASEEVKLAPGRYTLLLYAGSRYRSGKIFKHWWSFLRDLANLLHPEDPGKDLRKYLDRCYASVTFAQNAGRSLPAGDLSRRPEALIEFTCVQDEVLFTQPFRIERKTGLRIYALGEARWQHDILADYAWIEDAATGELVWLMEERDTEHAGGADKNRLFDGEVRLSLGDYLVHYLTDDSHSCEGWNDRPPVDPFGWGLAVLPGKGFRPGDLKKLRPADLVPDPRVLVRLTKVRDYEHRRQRFRLDRPARLHIYALGEGDRDEMWDLGWIVDLQRKRTVWRMVWRDTERAGGDRKNRLFDGFIELPAGDYEAHFETDDSHALGTWNADAPREPHLWGMTVTLAD